jgi:chemotaxis protein methyltransferase CheR
MTAANHNHSNRSHIPLDTIIRTMERMHGLDISDYELSFLDRTIDRRLKATGCQTRDIYLAEHLQKDTTEAMALHRSLCVGFSAFFRDSLTFALLENQILPDLVEKARKTGRTRLRIWSAGCAAGQEAWSIAILLDEVTAPADRKKAWCILATDLYGPDLALARAGVYSSTELGNVRLRHLNACFIREGQEYAVAEYLREQVEFADYNLLAPGTLCPPASIYGDFDLVLCCNVLFYYRFPQQIRILDKLLGCLAPGGYGGDEFLLVMPEAGEKQAFQTCQRIRKMVEEMQIEWEGRVIPVTVSLGLTCFNPAETAMAIDAEQLVKAADDALYKAKQTGRNTVAANFIKQ